MRFKKVAIIGVGLIGGSLGMAIKSRRLAEVITGVTRHRSTLILAKKHNALDRSTIDSCKAVKDADLAIIATPISRIVKIAKDIAPHLKPGCIVTDVGSVKGVIVREIEKMARIRRKEIYFVGGHPMAGSEKSGVSFAKSDLFKNTICFLTSTPRTDQRALNKVKNLWGKIGAVTEIVSPQKHDRIVAYISHLPHLLAYNLLIVTPPQYYRYAAGSFLDMTRIVSSDPQLWQDVCRMNSGEIDRLLREHNISLNEIKGLIASGRFKKLLNLFARAKSRRDTQ